MEENSVRRRSSSANPRTAVAFLVGLLILGSMALCRADDSEPPPRLLLMRNGSIVQGRILAKGDDYLVGLPHGQMFVPGNLVRASCRDLQEAFELLRERAAAQSEAEAYITLAKWCAAQKLFDEARESLQTALTLDAGKDEARDLLIRTEELRREDEQLRSDAASERPAQRKAGNDLQSLGGLRPDLALQFTRRIQPILTNNCSLSGCHGPQSETGFRLQRVALGVTPNRVAVERNLANVLKFVDGGDPAASAILTVPKENHGKGGKPVFRGPSGKDQIAELRKWVLEVAREDLVRSRPMAAEAALSELSPPDEDDAARAAQPAGENQSTEANPRKSAQHGKPASRIRHAAAEEEDLFNPEAFNRSRNSRRTR